MLGLEKFSLRGENSCWLRGRWGIWWIFHQWKFELARFECDRHFKSRVERDRSGLGVRVWIDSDPDFFPFSLLNLVNLASKMSSGVFLLAPKFLLPYQALVLSKRWLQARSCRWVRNHKFWPPPLFRVLRHLAREQKGEGQTNKRLRMKIKTV